MAMALSKLVSVAVTAGISISAAAFFLIFYLRRKEEREFEAQFSAYYKRNTKSANQSVIRVKVPRNSLGAVIGRKGANIKEIQELTNTKVDFPNKDSCDDECVAVIRGHADDIRVAEMKINEAIREHLSIDTEEMFIPSEACGRIIGRSGENIRYMCRVSKAKINVESKNSSANRLQRVTIRGTPEQIAFGKALINEKISELDQEQKTTLDPHAERKILSLGSPDDTQPYGLDDLQSERLLSTSSDGFIEVFISAANTPYQFWVQIVQGGKSTELDKLIEDMTVYYEQNEGSNILEEVKVGDVVAAPFNHDSSWYRARVEYVDEDAYSPAEKKVTLLYLDFGDVETLMMNQLRSLDRSGLRLPLQAIECHLGDIEPIAGAWTKEACQTFASLCYVAQWKALMLRVLEEEECGSGNNRVSKVVLIDTSGPCDVNIADELVKQGHAKWVISELESVNGFES